MPKTVDGAHGKARRSAVRTRRGYRGMHYGDAKMLRALPALGHVRSRKSDEKESYVGM